jgi:plasmid stabilization system protein ParE
VRAITFTKAARQELVHARDWYESESQGLGQRFLNAVDATIERIVANPLQFPIVHKSTRRALLRRFPYALMFVTEAEESLTIIACFHGSRDPARWQRRA